MPRLVLYQPDIPQNLGSLLRLAACTGLALHIIEPCGFPFDDGRIRRAGMDYIEHATYHRHTSWEAFRHHQQAQGGRLILMTTKTDVAYTSHPFAPDDWVMFGRESAGVPESVHQAADLRLTIPMQGGARSLNLAMSAAMVAGEITRQTTPSSSPFRGRIEEGVATPDTPSITANPTLTLP